MPAFVLIKILAPGFFARHDTATPVKIAVLAMVVNAACTFLLGFVLPLAHVGIAMATSIAGWVNALGLLTMLARRGHFVLDSRARRSIPRIAAAALGMGILLLVLERALAAPLAGVFAERLTALVILVAAGLAGFAALALLAGAADWRDLLRRLRRRAA